MLSDLVSHFDIVLLIFVRVMALALVAPLISSSAIPSVARVGVAMFATAAVYPTVAAMGYPVPDQAGQYLLLLLGEALVGVVIGFFVLLVFSAFQVAGQFFSLQMGLGASQVFDPLAQIQIPLMGQFLYLIAMLVFVFTDGLQKLFLVGVAQSFESLRAVDLVQGRDVVFSLFLRGLGRLFENALTISFPILGSLLLVSVSMGLLAKAAPQMNLLMMGFPISIGTAYLILFLIIPFLMTAFGQVMDSSFESLSGLFGAVGKAGGSP